MPPAVLTAHMHAQPQAAPCAITKLSHFPAVLQVTNNPENDGCINAVLLV